MCSFVLNIRVILLHHGRCILTHFMDKELLVLCANVVGVRFDYKFLCSYVTVESLELVSLIYFHVLPM